MKRSTPGSRHDLVAMRAARRAPPTWTSTDRWWSTSSACSHGAKSVTRPGRSRRGGCCMKARSSETGRRPGGPACPGSGSRPAGCRRGRAPACARRSRRNAIDSSTRPPWPSLRGCRRCGGRPRRPGASARSGSRFVAPGSRAPVPVRRSLARRPRQQTQLAAEAAQALGVAGWSAMVRRKMQQQVRGVRPVDRHQRVVIAAADAGAVQQQVELGERRDGGGAVGEHLHVAGRLVGVAVLQMPAGGQQRAGRDGIAQPRLLLPVRVGRRRRAEQGDVAGGDAVGDAAEGFLVVRRGRRCGDRPRRPCPGRGLGRATACRRNGLLGAHGRDARRTNPRSTHPSPTSLSGTIYSVIDDGSNAICGFEGENDSLSLARAAGGVGAVCIADSRRKL